MQLQAKRFAAALAVVLVLLALTGCPSDNNALRQAAVAAKDASSTVAVFQDAEIASFKTGVVDAGDHQLIQGMLLQISDIGKGLNAGLRAANDNTSAIRVIAVAVNQLDELARNGDLHIKNPDLKLKWSIAMIGVKTTLNSIAVMLDKGAVK